MTESNGTTTRVLEVLNKNHGKALDMQFIANEARVHWNQAHRVVTELILKDLAAKHPDALKDLVVVPEKSTKSWIFRPQLKQIEEVA